MTDRVVLITGSGSGIGAVIAAQVAAEGDRVVVANTDASAAAGNPHPRGWGTFARFLVCRMTVKGGIVR